MTFYLAMSVHSVLSGWNVLPHFLSHPCLWHPIHPPGQSQVLLNFCLHSQDLPFAPKPKQCFLLAGSPLMVLTSSHHASWSFVCSPLSASFQNVISLRAVIRNHSSMNSCIHSFNRLPIQQLFVYYWFNNTIEHLPDTEGRFRYWGSKDKRD